MALTYPLSLTAFANQLPFLSSRWELRRSDEFSGLGTGEILAANLGPALWMASVTLKPLRLPAANSILALLEALEGSLRAFYLFNHQQAYPQSDPGGVLVASTSPVIHTLGGDNKSLRISGLPSSFVMTRGDMLSFDYGSPARRAFHRVMETVTASSGLTPSFEVRPHIRPGAATSTAVSLSRPAAKMILMPGTFNPGEQTGHMVNGISFQAIQTLAT